MYKCNFCNETQLPGTKLNLLPTAIRTRLYRNKNNALKGFEIVTEENACPSCYENKKDNKPEITDHKEDDYVPQKKEWKRRPEHDNNRV